MQSLNMLMLKNEAQVFQVRDALSKLKHESICEIINSVGVRREVVGKVETA